MKKSKSKFLRILFALIVCVLCSFSFLGVGCPGIGGGGQPGKGTNLVPGGGATGSTAPEPEEEEVPSLEDVIGEEGTTIEDYNEVFAGAIAVYDADQNSRIFYDKYQQKNLTFKELIDRQFDTMTNYIYNTLTKVYGTTIAANAGGITGYKGTVNYNYVDTISTALQKELSGLKTGTTANKETLNYTDAINGGYKILSKEVTVTDEETGESKTTLSFDKYSDTEKVSTNAWKKASKFNSLQGLEAKAYIKKALMNMYIAEAEINVDTSKDFDFKSSSKLYDQYRAYNPQISIDNAYAKINKLGISKRYIWHVAYFIGYDLIGETNLNNSIEGAKKIFSGSTIKKLENVETANTALFDTYQNYKGYESIVEDIAFNMSKLAVPSSGTVSFSNSVNYFNGTNLDTTMFPRIQQNEYIFYDDVNNISDVKPSPEPDEDEEYDPDEESEPTLEGTPRKLKEVIYIPQITMEDLKDGLFNVDTLFLGLKKKGGSDFTVKITFDAIFNNSSKVANKKELIFSTDYKNISNNKVVVTGDYDDMEHTIDGAMFTEEELEKKEDYRLGDAELKNKESIATFITNSFNKENYTIKYSDGSTFTYEIARMCVYNSLYDSDFNLNFTKNYIRFNFDYYTTNGSDLSSVPTMYLMYFMLESM